MQQLLKNTEYIFWLNFHGLGAPGRELPPGEIEYWLDPFFLRDILDIFCERKDVQITFDDANESDYTIALSLLKARKMTARFFVVAERIDQKGFLSRQQIRELCAEGMAVENHGMQHRSWMQLKSTDLYKELIEARDLIQDITGRPITEAACPLGEYDRRTIRMLRKAGYRKVFTSDRGIARADSWIQPRITILRNDSIAKIIEMCSAGPWNAELLWRDLKMLIKRWR